MKNTMEKNRLILNSPFDAHLHLRDAELLKTTVPVTAQQFAGAFVMPNLKPPITTKEQIEKYKKQILDHTDLGFDPRISFFLSPSLTPKDIEGLHGHTIAAKMYPAGATTNSDGGVEGFDSPELKAQLKTLEDLGIPLAIHGETNGFVLDREREFAFIYEKFAKEFPKLKVMMEHISTKEVANLVDKYENLYATVTVHHLTDTLDDLIGGMFNPHLFCKPTVKLPSDRDAIQKLVFSGNEKVMFGSDSAPHLKKSKESANGAAGVFTAPVILPRLAEVFEKNDKLDQLQSFVSDRAIKIYNLDLPKREVILEKRDFIVPEDFGGVTPYMAGKTISWSLI